MSFYPINEKIELYNDKLNINIFEFIDLNKNISLDLKRKMNDIKEIELQENQFNLQIKNVIKQVQYLLDKIINHNLIDIPMEYYNIKNPSYDDIIDFSYKLLKLLSNQSQNNNFIPDTEKNCLKALIHYHERIATLHNTKINKLEELNLYFESPLFTEIDTYINISDTMNIENHMNDNNSDYVNCQCMGVKSDFEYIQCDMCNKWYHSECIGLKSEDYNLSCWFCMDCSYMNDGMLIKQNDKPLSQNSNWIESEITTLSLNNTNRITNNDRAYDSTFRSVVAMDENDSNDMSQSSICNKQRSSCLKKFGKKYI